jgi:RNA polymerase sigma factor (sigma-70 family)
MRAVTYTEPDTLPDSRASDRTRREVGTDAVLIRRSLREPERFAESYYRALARADANDAVDGHTEGVALRLDARTLRGRLAAALVDIAEGDREVLLLVAWAQLSCEEAARALGIPAGTARSRLHRARKKTRAALADAHPESTGKDDE